MRLSLAQCVYLKGEVSACIKLNNSEPDMLFQVQSIKGFTARGKTGVKFQAGGRTMARALSQRSDRLPFNTQ
jgi:hypothetical protein